MHYTYIRMNTVISIQIHTYIRRYLVMYAEIFLRTMVRYVTIYQYCPPLQSTYLSRAAMYVHI